MAVPSPHPSPSVGPLLFLPLYPLLAAPFRLKINKERLIDANNARAYGTRRRRHVVVLSRTSQQDHSQTEAQVTTATRGPVVILPGLGNSYADYVELSRKLEQRGHSHVETVPIKRWQWSLNARGFFTAAYWKCELTPNPFLDWYIQSVHDTVTALQEKVINDSKGNIQQETPIISILGHSAGGWLARVYLAQYGVNVQSLVTLGTPHLAPPDGVIDQTRGLLTYVAQNCDIRTRVDKFVCVAGKGIVGKPLGAGSLGQYVAYLSYASVCGTGQVNGDGVTPVQAASTDGAELVTCECDHSMLTSPANWYGSDDVLPQWADYLW